MGRLFVLAVLARSAPADEATGEPRPRRLDRVLHAATVGPAAPQAGDAEFLRRVSLDLAGMPPSNGELREFLEDKTAEKRARRIDRLLSSPLFARQWANTLDVMLMERRPNVHVGTADEWQAYLLHAAQSNRPLNQGVERAVEARINGADPKLRRPPPGSFSRPGLRGQPDHARRRQNLLRPRHAMRPVSQPPVGQRL